MIYTLTQTIVVVAVIVVLSVAVIILAERCHKQNIERYKLYAAIASWQRRTAKATQSYNTLRDAYHDLNHEYATILSAREDAVVVTNLTDGSHELRKEKNDD